MQEGAKIHHLIAALASGKARAGLKPAPYRVTPDRYGVRYVGGGFGDNLLH